MWLTADWCRGQTVGKLEVNKKKGSQELSNGIARRPKKKKKDKLRPGSVKLWEKKRKKRRQKKKKRLIPHHVGTEDGSRCWNFRTSRQGTLVRWVEEVVSRPGARCPAGKKEKGKRGVAS